jgi:hypothetical protein
MPSQNRFTQIIEAFLTRLAFIALAMILMVMITSFNDFQAIAMGTAYFSLPTERSNDFVTLCFAD